MAERIPRTLLGQLSWFRRNSGESTLVPVAGNPGQGMCDYSSEGEIWPLSESERRKLNPKRNKRMRRLQVTELPERYPLVVESYADERVRKLREKQNQPASTLRASKRNVLV